MGKRENLVRIGAPRLVALTDGSLVGRRTVAILDALGIPVDVVRISYPIPKRRGRALASYLRMVARAWIASIGPLRTIKHRALPPYPSRSVYGGRCNGQRMLSTLATLRPDYILMMGGPILSQAAIDTASCGILNAHPGLLPWMRGVDVIRHAVLREVPLGVTGHFIDAGIDSGDIVTRFLLPVQDGDGFEQLAQRADILATAILVDMARRVYDGESLPRARAPERFPLCRTLDSEGVRRAEERLRAGIAAKAYRQPPLDPTIQDGQTLLQKYDRWCNGGEQL